MRAFLVIASIVCCAACSGGEKPAAEQSIHWQESFHPRSASQADDSLVLVLITNDEPFRVAQSSVPLAREAAEGETVLNPPLWCIDDLQRVCRNAMQRRPDLRQRLSYQSIAAGLPSGLTAGKDHNTPSRAVLAICSGDYRLLALTVGLPNVDELLTLIEDAEDVAILLQLHSEHPSETMRAVAERSRERLERVWRSVLDEMIVAMNDEDRGDETQGAVDVPSPELRLRIVRETLTPVYVADVRLRFGLSDAIGRTRLVILEQHVETRRTWCEATIPMVAGLDFTHCWRGLVETIWIQPPITAEADADELLSWFDLHNKTDTVVLMLQPPLHLQYLPWPPIVDKGAQRGVGWQQAHAQSIEYPFRSVNTQQLAVLIRSRELTAINTLQSGMIRYLVIEARNRKPNCVRDTDSPGRLVRLLKRSTSKLARE